MGVVETVAAGREAGSYRKASAFGGGADAVPAFVMELILALLGLMLHGMMIR